MVQYVVLSHCRPSGHRFVDYICISSLCGCPSCPQPCGFTQETTYGHKYLAILETVGWAIRKATGGAREELKVEQTRLRGELEGKKFLSLDTEIPRVTRDEARRRAEGADASRVRLESPEAFAEVPGSYAELQKFCALGEVMLDDQNYMTLADVELLAGRFRSCDYARSLRTFAQRADVKGVRLQYTFPNACAPGITPSVYQFAYYGTTSLQKVRFLTRPC
jgi:hypothetical protein